MRVTNFVISKSNYVIPIVLFLASFSIYEYNLSGQPWHGDEITYLGWGGNYFHLIANGHVGDSCLSSLDHCHLLFHIPAFGLTYSPIRNVLIGGPMYTLNQDAGNFYNWSCYWDCYNHNEGPSIAEMTAGRLLSPMFGSLSVVLAFFIGKMLFNRGVGIIVSFFLLFYDLWIWYSRSIMVEVHYVFFALLSLFFLLYAFKNEKRRTLYFILSAVVFGIALNSKMLSVCFSGLLLCIVLFQNLSCRKINDSRRYLIGKTSLMVFSFLSLSVLGVFLVEPGFYQDPLNEIKTMKSDMDNYNHDVWYIGYPSLHNLQLKSVISAVHYVLFPSFIEQQVSNPNSNLSGNFGWTYPPTYSSIPMTMFFFIGFGYLVHTILKSRSISNELLLLVWFASTFILTLVIVKDFSLERYLLPLGVSILFITSYGLWKFILVISNNKLKIAFVAWTIFAHLITSLLYWEKIYFSPGTTWVNPLHYGTLQESFDNFFTFSVGVSYVLFFLVVLTIRSRAQPIKVL